jgi:hypothetical protein
MVVTSLSSESIQILTGLVMTLPCRSHQFGLSYYKHAAECNAQPNATASSGDTLQQDNVKALEYFFAKMDEEVAKWNKFLNRVWSNKAKMP